MKSLIYKDKKYFFYYDDKLGLHGLENAFYQPNRNYVGHWYNRKTKGFWLEKKYINLWI
jgi:hypothetical protein